MTSWISILQKIQAFCNAHIQIQKFGGEFREQMPNFATQDEKYPIIYIEPDSDTEDLLTNQFTFNVYCVDIIQKDRANINTITSDCQLILKDLYVYYKNDNDPDIDVLGTATMTPLNNLDLDYVAGWVMNMTVELAQESDCWIPMSDITPEPPVECEPVEYTITDSQLNVLYSGEIPSGGELNQVISNSIAKLKDTAFNDIGTYSILAEDTSIIIAPNATLHIKAEDDGTITNLSLLSNSANEYTVANNDILVNGNYEFYIHATNSLDIRLRDKSNNVLTPTNIQHAGNQVKIELNVSTPVSGATLMKTNQSVSYRTGDDGDIEAGRAVSFTVLSVNNPFGNSNRFTDELGGQTYTNNIVIDWSTFNGSTVLGWYKGAFPIEVWNTAIDNALALSVDTFTSGWRLPNATEAFSILNYGASSAWNYAPFNNTTLSVVWTATTYNAGTSNAMVSWSDHRIAERSKASTSYSMRCRTFTVTGTTLS